jgi:hypothetical protein
MTGALRRSTGSVIGALRNQFCTSFHIGEKGLQGGCEGGAPDTPVAGRRSRRTGGENGVSIE